MRALWLIIWESPRGLGGGLDKPKGFAPQGRGHHGVHPSHPLQWSSEYADTELGLLYYNYRYYNPTDGRWTRRDPKNGKITAIMRLYTAFVNKSCCVQGQWYKEAGKYCISFGMYDNTGVGISSGAFEDGGVSDSDSGGESSISTDEKHPLMGQVPFPAAFDGPNPDGDGIVYLDMKDKALEEIERTSTRCCQQDIRMRGYLSSLVGQRANYALLGQNCRDFSHAVYGELVSSLDSNDCK